MITDTRHQIWRPEMPPFEKINVNGRVPAIEDANTRTTLWESGAIIEYLAETYDKNKTLTFAQSPEKLSQPMDPLPGSYFRLFPPSRLCGETRTCLHSRNISRIT